MSRGLWTALAAVGAAQLCKAPIHYARTGKWSMRRVIGAGGMPSAHSSGVAALAVYTGLRYGWKTPEFAVAAMLGSVVMYDAVNIRRHTGEMAIQVNDLDADVEKLAGHHPGVYHQRRSEKLEESLGHQPVEVAAGALLGAAIGAVGAMTAR